MKNLLYLLSFLATSLIIAQPNAEKPINPLGIAFHKDHFMFKGPVKQVVTFSKRFKYKDAKDMFGNTVSVKDGFSYEKEHTYSFDADGYLMEDVNHGSFTDIYEYDEKKHLSRMVRKKSYGSDIYFSFHTDRNGNVTEDDDDEYYYNESNLLEQYTEGITSRGARSQTDYTYDTSGRLTKTLKRTGKVTTTDTYSYKKSSKGLEVTTVTENEFMTGSRKGQKKTYAPSTQIYKKGVCVEYVSSDGDGGDTYEYTLDRYDNCLLYDHSDKEHVRSSFKKDFSYY